MEKIPAFYDSKTETTAIGSAEIVRECECSPENCSCESEDIKRPVLRIELDWNGFAESAEFLVEMGELKAVHVRFDLSPSLPTTLRSVTDKKDVL